MDNRIYVIIELPNVPRVGELLFLSKSSNNNLVESIILEAETFNDYRYLFNDVGCITYCILPHTVTHVQHEEGIDYVSVQLAYDI